MIFGFCKSIESIDKPLIFNFRNQKETYCLGSGYVTDIIRIYIDRVIINYQFVLQRAHKSSIN